jgi:hypothetical protein
VAALASKISSSAKPDPILAAFFALSGLLPIATISFFVLRLRRYDRACWFAIPSRRVIYTCLRRHATRMDIGRASAMNQFL